MKAIKKMILSVVVALASTTALADEVCRTGAEVARYVMKDRQYEGDPVKALARAESHKNSFLAEAVDDDEREAIYQNNIMTINLIRRAYVQNVETEDKDKDILIKDFVAEYYAICSSR